MSGIAYAIGEILLFLIIATALGVLIGRALPRRLADPPVPTDAKVAELETKSLILEGRLEKQADQLDRLKSDLLKARTQAAIGRGNDVDS